MTLESSIQALADAIDNLADAYRNKQPQEFTPPPAPVESKPEKSKKKPKKEKPQVEEEKNPYQEHPDQVSPQNEVLKMARAEFARVVKARGEDVSVELLNKYSINAIDNLSEHDIASFLKDCAALAEGDGRKGVNLEEVTFDKIKKILTAIHMKHGGDSAKGILEKFGAKKLSDLEEKHYLDAYETAINYDKVPF